MTTDDAIIPDRAAARLLGCLCNAEKGPFATSPVGALTRTAPNWRR
jgi:hypothetical protein